MDASKNKKSTEGDDKTLFWKGTCPSELLSFIPIGREESALCFLHGVCGVFALALHDQFGYALEVAAEDNTDGLSWEERLVHIYCRDDDDNFVDVRGIISNQELFMEDFEDFFNPARGDYFELSGNDLRRFLGDCMSAEELAWLYQAADKLIHDNIDGYNILNE